MDEQPRYCACGCGKIITSKNKDTKYIKGHMSPEKRAQLNSLMSNPELIAKIKAIKLSKKQLGIKKRPYKKKERPFCLCGCGLRVNRLNAKYLPGHCFKDPKYYENIKKAFLKKYGSESIFTTNEFKEKAKQTNIEKYGREYFLQSDKCKEIRENYKKENNCDYTQTKHAKEKRLRTNIEKYGTDNPSKSQIIIDKIKDSFSEKYGNEYTNASQISEFQKKRENTMLEKYGVNSVLKLESVRQLSNNRNRELAWKRIINDPHWEPLFTKDEFMSKGWKDDKPVDQQEWYNFKCKKCGNIQKLHVDLILCTKCYPNKFRSSSEKEIEEYIQTFNINVEHSNRTILNGRELDIYIPSKQLAIEYDGLYWHNISNQPDSKYHLNKTLQCNEKNIQLIHVFDDEWLYKQDIVKSRIKNLLGIYDKIIYARKCTIKEISDPIEYSLFLEDNHLQGFIASRYNIGLYYNDELVSLMTFGPYRKSMNQENKENCYEMYRFCNKLGYHIPGAASKLFKYFIKTYNPDEITTYADRRWSNGNLYYKLGFTLDHISQPNYWYTKDYLHREYRFKYRKSELPKLLESFDPTQTEQQNMLNNGYDIIYDCGNYVFKWKRNC